MDTKISLSYRESHPPDSISHLVFCFFEFSAEGPIPESIPHSVYPDGCISLLFRRNKSIDHEMLLVRGLEPEAFETEVHTGDSFYGVKLAPEAHSVVLRCEPSEVKTQPVDGDEGFAPHLVEGLTEKLKTAISYEMATRIFSQTLEGLEIPKTEIDEAVAESVKKIYEARGDLKIDDLGKATGLSTRQLVRRFRAAVGLTPKQYARMFRLRATQISLIEESELNWANRAAALGFSDQSHLIREFKALTGRSPSTIQDNISGIDLGDLKT
ncbi:MAG: AraC family transcriptional regulator [Pyrinomonadaceae bacterium]|nr:AraC family transcriptional regulator [Pyrinomonadaceae bacterium]